MKEKCELYIVNQTCPTFEYKRTVQDEELPIVTVATPESGWHCYLPREDYMELFRLIETYEGGELIVR